MDTTISPERVSEIAASNVAAFEDQWQSSPETKEDCWQGYYANCLDSVQEEGGTWEQAVDAANLFTEDTSWKPVLYR